MSKKFLENNVFTNCTRSELLWLWYHLKCYYELGWFKKDSPLQEYHKFYVSSCSHPIKTMEHDLLIAIANEFCGGC